MTNERRNLKRVSQEKLPNEWRGIEIYEIPEFDRYDANRHAREEGFGKANYISWGHGKILHRPYGCKTNNGKFFPELTMLKHGRRLKNGQWSWKYVPSITVVPMEWLGYEPEEGG
jgi:hypothetical protein